MHEMAKSKGKKFERVVASAGAGAVGDFEDDFEQEDSDMIKVETLNVRRGHAKHNSAEFPQSIE